MKNHDENKELSNLKYWDVNGFNWIEKTFRFNKDCKKIYNEESDDGYFLKVDVQCHEKLHDLHNNLALLTERMNIQKVEKLVANFHDKKECVIHITCSKLA